MTLELEAVNLLCNGSKAHGRSGLLRSFWRDRWSSLAESACSCVSTMHHTAQHHQLVHQWQYKDREAATCCRSPAALLHVPLLQRWVDQAADLSLYSAWSRSPQPLECIHMATSCFECRPRPKYVLERQDQVGRADQGEHQQAAWLPSTALPDTAWTSTTSSFASCRSENVKICWSSGVPSVMLIFTIQYCMRQGMQHDTC